jgi:hypothetical protein
MQGGSTGAGSRRGRSSGSTQTLLVDFGLRRGEERLPSPSAAGELRAALAAVPRSPIQNIRPSRSTRGAPQLDLDALAVVFAGSTRPRDPGKDYKT